MPAELLSASPGEASSEMATPAVSGEEGRAEEKSGDGEEGEIEDQQALMVANSLEEKRTKSKMPSLEEEEEG